MRQIIYLKNKENNMIPIEYEITKSRRKTVAIVLCADGSFSLRLPLYARESEGLRFLQTKSDWVTAKKAEYDKAAATKQDSPLTPAQEAAFEKRYREAAAEYIPKRAAFYANLMGASYGRISIRAQKTRWGSCSSRGTLSFNWRLMLAPPAVLDYVVLHELCHTLHMNHSKAFWNSVEDYMPDYKKHRLWLKQHGNELMTRCTVS